MCGSLLRKDAPRTALACHHMTQGKEAKVRYLQKLMGAITEALGQPVPARPSKVRGVHLAEVVPHCCALC